MKSLAALAATPFARSLPAAATDAVNYSAYPIDVPGWTPSGELAADDLPKRIDKPMNIKPDLSFGRVLQTTSSGHGRRGSRT
jgi:hypothetical protein